MPKTQYEKCLDKQPTRMESKDQKKWSDLYFETEIMEHGMNEKK